MPALIVLHIGSDCYISEVIWLFTRLLEEVFSVTVFSTKDGSPKRKVDPCGVCSLRVKANFVLCVQCCRWIQGRYVTVKMVTAKIFKNFACKKCGGSIGKAVEQEEKYAVK